MEITNVFVADDHRMLREGLSIFLNSHPDIKVVGESFRGAEIEKCLQDAPPDVLLLDTALVQSGEIESVHSLHKMAPDTKIIMVSSHDRDECVHETLNDGAVGFIIKQARSQEIVEAIQQVMRGHYYLSPTIQNMVIATYLEGTRTKPRHQNKRHDKYAGYNRLSTREAEVFKLLLEGLSRKEISQKLEINPKTTDKHRASIFRKTGVENTTQLLHYALELKLLPESKAI